MLSRSLLLVLLAAAASAHAEAPSKPVVAALQPDVDPPELAGAVTMVATKDKVIDVETVGWADVAAKKPIQADALFWIASMSKAITAAGLMVLVDEGKVKLDDPVEKYLPEFKGQMVIAEKDAEHILLKKPKHPITVRNVLSHTSGLPFKSPIEEPTLDMIPLVTAVKSHAMSALLFEPDSKYQYANAGINTAGRIIEVVSGMSYEDFMQKRLFDPLGMKDTTFWPNDEQVARLAKSYKPNAAKNDLEETTVTQCHYPLQDRRRQPMPGGGLFATAADVVAFCQLLMNHGMHKGQRVLSEASVQEMTSRQTQPQLKESYGFGLQVTPDGFGHGGAYATNMSVDLAHGLITVFMVQHAGFPGNGKESGGKFKEAALKAFGDR